MAKYRVLDMHLRLAVGDKVRDFAPGDVVELSPEEAEKIGKNVEPVPADESEGAEGGKKGKKEK
ncbi:MAG: hypothetical protein M0Z38_13280 [Deltaproteobacteria bacterium]|nr:hypothetical protein [Deltaproteobacteria bacterium]